MQGKQLILYFVDIDGVMNSNRYYTSRTAKQISKDRDEYGDGFDPVSKKWMNRLIGETGGSVVISSVLRGQGLDAMRCMWKSRGMSGEVLGVTPYLRLHGDNPVSVPRGLEIKMYYETVHKFMHRTYDAPFLDEIRKECDLLTYVIFDDDQDMLYEQRDNFVWCYPLYGFGEKEYKKALAIVNDAKNNNAGDSKCPCDNPAERTEPWCIGCELKRASY